MISISNYVSKKVKVHTYVHVFALDSYREREVKIVPTLNRTRNFFRFSENNKLIFLKTIEYLSKSPGLTSYIFLFGENLLSKYQVPSSIWTQYKV